MVTLIRFKRELFLWLDALLAHVVHFRGKDLCCRRGRVDTVCLDGDDDGSSLLEEVVGVECNDTCLVGLGDVGKDHVDHLQEHAVLLGVAGVVDDGWLLARTLEGV